MMSSLRVVPLCLLLLQTSSAEEHPSYSEHIITECLAQGFLERSLAIEPSDEDQTPPQQTRGQFFAGTVTALSPERITVMRSTVGRRPEQRAFAITSTTKMSKFVIVQSKVTVRYRHLPEGDVALEIRLHSQNKPARPS